jgi:exopolyphosphatase / guanosine-5'-triphosphate,3'-diphosphate pyrophosphatase
MASAPRRIAAIDVGTNSIHMVVAELRRSGHRVVDKEKEMVQLGLGSLNGRPLGDDAMARGAAAVAHMAEVARGWEVDDIVAVATSAVREAPNRRDFLRLVKETSGIKIRVISGEEEADYIYRAVRSTVDLEGGTALCVDIGGGSVEFVIGTASEIYFTASEPIGSLRLAQQFHLQDLAAREAIESCRRFAAEHLRKVQKKVRRIGVDQCIGTSGTIQALANAAAASENNPTVSRMLTREALADVVARLAGTTARERVERLAIDEKRAATIVAGAAVLTAIMDAARLPSILACPVGIREGILEAQLGAAQKPEEGRSKRRLSVAALARRSDCDGRHSQHVARLASRIFDQTAHLHGLKADRRELLEYAALLHEAGMHISDRGYHKHTYYLVRHATLRGFTEQQLIIVANVARYHRKAKPGDDHENLGEVSAADRADIEKLAAILRIAEALDRSHRQAVRDVAVRSNGGGVKFLVRTRSDASVELDAASKRARYFGEIFDRKVRFQLL